MGAASLPPLQDRFLEPPGWRWHSFTRDGRTLRFGSVSPKDSIPDATVVCLPGLGDFSEKYFETARDMLSRNLAFWVIEWVGQGRSGRYRGIRPQRRHSENFDKDIADLHHFIDGYVKPASVHPDVGRVPMVMLAHSMGGNIGLRYLADHPEMFACAVFSAPMVGILAMRPFGPLGFPIVSLLKALGGKRYAPGATDWRENWRSDPLLNIFSHDPVRAAVHNAWCLRDPQLQCGGVTNGWLYHAAQSCRILQKPETLEAIRTPCLIALAGKERLVDNSSARRAARWIQACEVLELPSSFHEILMETDDIRGVFMEACLRMVQVHAVHNPESLKRF